MGDVYEAVCADCGYETEGLRDGTGLTGTFLEPVVCLDCRALVSVVTADLYSDLGPELNACPQCSGHRLAALPTRTLDEQAVTGAFRFGRWAECPRCNGRLAVTPTGHW